MEPIRWKIGHVIDAHVHFENDEPVPHFHDNVDLVNCAKCCILGLPLHEEQNEWLIERKRERPDRYFIFARLHHDLEAAARGDGRALVPQVQRLLAAGFDGIKMWEGKPTQRQAGVPLGFDHAYYRPYWDFVTEHAVPVTVHLADPAFCWKSEKLKDAYRGAAPFEAYMQEAEAVLDAHPGLQISFAHFMHLSPWPDRLAGLFRRHAGLRVDLALGAEFLYVMSNDPEAGRRFFTTWQERILYGTDLNDLNSFRLARAKAETLRLFLETDETFPSLTALAQDLQPPVVHGRSDFRGLKLPTDVLENVMRRNFERFVGKEPRPLAE